MKPTVETLSISRRSDGTPWQIPIFEFTGATPGPRTAFIAGMWGDKPLGSIALHGLMDRLRTSDTDLAGSVLVVPAANPWAISTASRVSPDHLYLNRRFPGSDSGFLTDQIAHALHTALQDRVDNIIDVHSGTPTASLGYTYDYGDTALSSSFGLPVVVGHELEGQLCTVFSRGTGRAMLPEFGGGALDDPEAGVEGCLNVMRYLGHVGGEPTGPRTVPLIRDVDFAVASAHGILLSPYDSRRVGAPVADGVVAQVLDPATGRVIEEFHRELDDSIVLLARIVPSVVTPGEFLIAYGRVEHHIDVGTGAA